MSTIIRSKKYYCSDDCQMQGCPGHEMEIQIQTCADHLMISIDGKHSYGFDPNKFKTLVELLKDHNYHYFNLTKTK